MPYYIAWKCYPENRHLNTSLVNFAYILGTIIATIISSYLVNPQGLEPTIIVNEGGVDYWYYDQEIN